MLNTSLNTDCTYLRFMQVRMLNAGTNVRILTVSRRYDCSLQVGMATTGMKTYFRKDKTDCRYEYSLQKSSLRVRVLIAGKTSLQVRVNIAGKNLTAGTSTHCRKKANCNYKCTSTHCRKKAHSRYEYSLQKKKRSLRVRVLIAGKKANCMYEYSLQERKLTAGTSTHCRKES